jgi:hypothetical protein
MDGLAEWALENHLWKLPDYNEKRVFATKFKKAARRRRMRDGRQRLVRTVIAAKFRCIDENGQQYFDVMWDYLHETTVDFALVSFQQRDKNITKQRRSATRDLQSLLEFNPNMKGHEESFGHFAFMAEEPQQVVVEQVAETGASLSKRKPR